MADLRQLKLLDAGVKRQGRSRSAYSNRPGDQRGTATLHDELTAVRHALSGGCPEFGTKGSE